MIDSPLHAEPESAAQPPASPEQGRRRLLQWPLVMGLTAAMGPAWGQAAAPVGSNSRLALVIGNRVYPAGFDLPPTHKNVRDLAAALEKRGFTVTTAIDQDPGGLKRLIGEFARTAQASPPDATILYYFTGHGMQVDAENLMLGAGVAPNAASGLLLNSSLLLRKDVIDQLPRRPSGMTIAVIDACRTSLLAAQSATDGLNQVEAPPGCMIVFSTGAGKPAIAPAIETLNTFYTGSLVKLLLSSDDDMSFKDFFLLVKLDVTQSMLKHPVQAIRGLAQVPFIADYTQVTVPLSVKRSVIRVPTAPVPAPTPDGAASRAEQEAKARLEEEQKRLRDEAATLQFNELQEGQWPGDIRKLAEAFIEKFASSRQIGSAQVALAGASEALTALANREVKLFKSAFLPPNPPTALVTDLRRAGRGDKDAAARIGRLYVDGKGGVPADRNRYEGWMQFATALGNGIASYELAVHYRREGQSVPAAQYESRARELAYTPPLALDQSRK